MVWSDHDNNFKELNSQLLREVQALDWTRGAYAADAGAPQPHTSPAWVDPNDTMAVTARVSGKTLRELAGQDALAPVLSDARTAAGQVCNLLSRRHRFCDICSASLGSCLCPEGFALFEALEALWILLVSCCILVSVVLISFQPVYLCAVCMNVQGEGLWNLS